MKIKLTDIWCIIAPLMMMIICIITNAGWIEIVSSVTGVIYIALIAKENKYGYLFSIVNVIFYAILTWQKGLAGTAIFNILYSLPVLIYGYIFWNKNQGKDKGEIKIMSVKLRLKILLLMLVIILVYFFIAYNLFELNNAFVDAVVVCFSFVGNILMARKYIEQWYIWIGMNFTNIVFWLIQAISDTNAISLVFMYIIYLINNIIGLFSWNRKKKQISK